jgi:hypothetical protein
VLLEDLNLVHTVYWTSLANPIFNINIVKVFQPSDCRYGKRIPIKHTKDFRRSIVLNDVGTKYDIYWTRAHCIYLFAGNFTLQEEVYLTLRGSKAVSYTELLYGMKPI